MDNTHTRKSFTDYGVTTSTSDEQQKVEKYVSLLYSRASPGNYQLNRESHISYLKRSLKHLPDNFCCLDASRPWLVYWAIHALELLDVRLTGEEATNTIHFLNLCQNPEGGFGGGPGQYSHLAPTYAAVNALAIIGTKEALNIINRETLSAFLWSLRSKDGSFSMHTSGEVDIRGVYCALSVARLTNVYTKELFDNTLHWILRCQTYEGGFGGAPGLEAHGGYTFCGVAALALMKGERHCDIDSLLSWAVNRQMSFEGGFQGRTNKLVDGCYSFWQGGLFPILHSMLTLQDPSGLSLDSWMFNQEALQEYILICCQHDRGGLIDKPGKYPDLYHTCYCLSGLSIAQQFSLGTCCRKNVLGNKSNELVSVHPLYNIGIDSAVSAAQYFNSLPVP